MTPRISRRTVLRGFGTALALPCLEAMLPHASAAAPKAVSPKRMAFVYVPNGIHMQDFTPASTGRGWELPELLQPLGELRDYFSVLTGLTCDKARPNGDGPGDHARAMASFLTGRQARKTAGSNIKVGISVDQLAAQRLGDATRFPSLEIGAEGGRLAGSCDSGYSCAYSSNISWRGEATPQPKETDPKLIFERLFGSASQAESAAAKAKRERYRKSILDLVAEDAGDLKRQLGSADQQKLEEYLNGVREVEKRLARTSDEKPRESPPPRGGFRGRGGPGIEYSEHLRLLADVLTLAFQADLTRFATFVFANEGSNRPYKNIGVSEGHHDLSHHGGNKDKQAKIRKINTFHLEQFAYLLRKFKDVKEGDRTLLDSCMIVYGSGNSDGNRHNHDNLPILLAGKGGGTIQPGQHIRFRRETPVANLYLSMLDNLGINVPSFGDSTGRLSGL
jgi:hypothetical protein